MNEKRSYCFVSNYLTPHQLPFCLEMKNQTNNNFVFIETETLPEERKRLGYPTLGEQYSFVLNATKSEEYFKKALDIATKSDITIIGSAPDAFIRQRLKKNKLTFRFSERIFKKKYFDLPRLAKYILKNFKYRSKNLYLLLSSAYAPHDYKRCGMSASKMLKWGYFPEVSADASKKIEKEQGKCVWVGRFLEWKHPDDAINAVIRLKNNGYNVSLDLIGTGKLLPKLEQIVKNAGADGYIKFLGSQPYDNVREYMRRSQIFLFNSDYNEGWGAVINEAMDSGCAIVASHAAGSVPFLIKNYENGLIYRFGDQEQLYECIEKLLSDPSLSSRLSDSARKTTAEEWNAHNATRKLIAFCEAFACGTPETSLSKTGVLSPADVIKQKNMYNTILKDE